MENIKDNICSNPYCKTIGEGEELKQYKDKAHRFFTCPKCGCRWYAEYTLTCTGTYHEEPDNLGMDRM